MWCPAQLQALKIKGDHAQPPRSCHCGWKIGRPTKPCHLTKWDLSKQLPRTEREGVGCQLRGRKPKINRS